MQVGTGGGVPNGIRTRVAALKALISYFYQFAPIAMECSKHAPLFHSIKDWVRPIVTAFYLFLIFHVTLALPELGFLKELNPKSLEPRFL
jgi:hypothetical protein